MISLIKHLLRFFIVHSLHTCCTCDKLELLNASNSCTQKEFQKLDDSDGILRNYKLNTAIVLACKTAAAADCMCLLLCSKPKQ